MERWGEPGPVKRKWSFLGEEATLRGPCPSRSMGESQGEGQSAPKGEKQNLMKREEAQGEGQSAPKVEKQNLMRREKDMHVLGNCLSHLPALDSSCAHPQAHWFHTGVKNAQEIQPKERRVHLTSQFLGSRTSVSHLYLL